MILKRGDFLFTGIIQEVGVFQRKIKESNRYKLIIKTENFLDDVSIGDSISVNGVCLTVVSYNSNIFTVDVMPETLESTNIKDLNKGSLLNLEKSLKPNSYMGGHIVSGHVDGIGVIKNIKKEKNARVIELKTNESILDYLVDKGSVAVNGISLTVMDVKIDSIIISIIPETWESTNLKDLKNGDKVNLEVDIVGKFVHKILDKKEEVEKKRKITKDLLKENGFI